MVIEPGGNNGDRLIYMGMEKKLKELSIDYTVLHYLQYRESLIYYGPWQRILKTLSVVSKSNKGLDMVLSRLDREIYKQTSSGGFQFDPTAVILIHGGGNMNDLWGLGLHLLRNVIYNNPESVIIVGPQSYWFWTTNFPKLFLDANQQIYLFCRERYSYNLLRSISLPKNVHVGLSHDTIFYLSEKDFHTRQGAYDLICFRTDDESIFSQKTSDLKRLPRSEIIDSRQSKDGIVVEDVSLISFGDFVNLIEGSRRVFTDRLHVAIISAILGKDTTLYPNSYYKNKGIYEYSLSSYPNVKFVDIQRNSKEFEANLSLLLTHICNLNGASLSVREDNKVAK